MANKIALEKTDSGHASMLSCRQEQVLKLIYGPFSKKLSNNGKDTLPKNNFAFVNINVMTHIGYYAKHQCAISK